MESQTETLQVAQDANGGVDDDRTRTLRTHESGWQAWLCILGAFSFIMPSYGKNKFNPFCGQPLRSTLLGFMQSIGTVNSYLVLNELSAYTVGEVGWITGTYLFLSYFFSIQIGPVCDYYGPLIVGLIGMAFTVTSFALMAECQTYWEFMLCLGVFAAIGGAIIATMAMCVVAKLFVRKRGLAMGVALTGSSIGSIIFPIILRSTLPRYGWKWSMRIMAFANLGVMIFGLLCLWPYRRVAVHSSRQGARRTVLFNLAAFRSRSFLCMAMGLFLLEFTIFSVAGLLPTLATGAGLSLGDGYTLIAILSACSCAGRILPGLVGDIIGPFNTILIMIATTLLFMGTLFVPFATRLRHVLYAFSGLWGFGSGSFLSIAPGEFRPLYWTSAALILPVCIGKICEASDYGRFYGKRDMLALRVRCN